MPHHKLREAVDFFRAASPPRAPHLAFVTATAPALGSAFVTEVEGANFCVLADTVPEGANGAAEAKAKLLQVGGMLSAYMRSRASSDGTDLLFNKDVWAQTLQHVPLWNESRSTSTRLAIPSKPVDATSIGKAVSNLPAEIGISDKGSLAQHLATAILDAWPAPDSAVTSFVINILLLVVNGATSPDGSQAVPSIGLFSADRSGGGVTTLAYGSWELFDASATTRQQVDALLANAPKDELTNAANFLVWPTSAPDAGNRGN